MQERILEFIDELRRAGLAPGPGESLDAVRAVAELGVERATLRACLAATLIKDHADRPVFDGIFDRTFRAPLARPGRRRTHREVRGESGQGRGGRAGEESPGHGRRVVTEEEHSSGSRDPREMLVSELSASPDLRSSPARAARESQTEKAARALARRRSLLRKPFHQMDPSDVEELRDSMRELAARFRLHCGRRRRRARRGRLDMRRTIRRALSHGGIPMELMQRRKRPRRADLVALVDLSYSTATAADFLLSLLAPSRTYFRRVTLLAYVDVPAEISFERGHIVPHSPLDLHARSDFGHVLRRLEADFDLVLGRNTILMVLGDARNNRRPPRADLLARLRRRVRAVVWLNPEEPGRWNTGDSSMATYARHVDLLLAAGHPRELSNALSRVIRKSWI